MRGEVPRRRRWLVWSSLGQPSPPCGSGSVASMFGKPLKIFTISGVPVFADPSVLIIAVLVAASVDQIFKAVGITEGRTPFAILASLLFLGSILWHEGAHAVVARLSKVHVRSVTLYMFGGATAADLDSDRPKEEFVVALVGPLSSLALSGILWMATNALPPGLLAGTLGYIAWINLLLAGFNLIPGFPLDGGRVLRAAVTWISGKPATGNVVAKWVGSAAGVMFIGWGVRDLSRGDVFGAIWIGYIGLIVLMSSQKLVQRESARDILRTILVRDAAQPAPGSLAEGMSLSEALDVSLRAYPEATFPVLGDDGDLVGMITLAQAAAVGQTDPLATVARAMGPIDPARVIESDQTLLVAAERFGDTPWMLVLDGGRLTGILSMQDVEAAYQQAQTSKAAG